MNTKLLALNEEINGFTIWRYRIKEYILDDLWRFLPYTYRPKELWYKLRCLFWERYSTVKPRWLGHTWIDRGDLIHFLAFELLAQYLDKEAHTIVWEQDDRYYEYQEMLRLRDWWENRYLKADQLTNHLYNKLDLVDLDSKLLEHIPDTQLFRLKKPPQKETDIYNKINEINARLSYELESNLQTLIGLRHLMWS